MGVRLLQLWMATQSACTCFWVVTINTLMWMHKTTTDSECVHWRIAHFIFLFFLCKLIIQLICSQMWSRDKKLYKLGFISPQDSSDAGSAERTHRVCVLSAQSRSLCGVSGPLGSDSPAPWGEMTAVWQSGRWNKGVTSVAKYSFGQFWKELSKHLVNLLPAN